MARLSKLPWYVRYRVGAKFASDMRRLAIMVTHQHCRVEFRGPVRLGPGFALNIPDRGTLIVGKGVDFRRGFVCEINGNGRVVIGDGSTFTSHALVQCTTSIEIGRGCVFGQSLMMADGKHRFGDATMHLLDQGYDYSPLRIGDGSVVMSKCTVTADIGEGSVIGANSVVNRAIPPHCLAGGVPAKVLRSFLADADDRATGGG
ncbi:MAG: acyltransferase [Acidimicrobiales bacterium]